MTANPVYQTGVLDAPSTVVELVITDAQLPEQPLNQKRFHVVVEARNMDSGQNIQCSRPFVRQE